MNNTKLALEQKIDMLLSSALKAKTKEEYTRLINEYKFLVEKVNDYKEKGLI